MDGRANALANQVSEALSDLVVLADGHDIPGGYELIAAGVLILDDLKYALARIGDHLEDGRMVRTEFANSFRFASRQAYLAADDLESLARRWNVPA